MNISEATPRESSKISAWLLAARPKTLPAGIAPVVLGSALAAQEAVFSWVPALLCLAFALLVQIGCNYANDYFDHKKGVDTKERVGFKRAVASGLISPESMMMGMVAVLTLAFIVGCSLVYYGGWSVFVVGLISIACAVLYTAGPYPIAYKGLGDIFVFIFFGLIAVMFTFYVQAGYFSMASFWVAVGCGFLAANIRIVNDVRDRKTDEKAGKKTWAVRYGKDFCFVQYLVGNGIAMGVPITLLAMGFKLWVLLAVIAAPLSLHLCVQFLKAKSGEAYNKLLVQTAQLMLGYAVLLSIGIALS